MSNSKCKKVNRCITDISIKHFIIINETSLKIIQVQLRIVTILIIWEMRVTFSKTTLWYTSHQILKPIQEVIHVYPGQKWYEGPHFIPSPYYLNASHFSRVIYYETVLA